MDYSEYLRSRDWLDKRFRKRLRKDHCAICAATEDLHVHHLNYRNLYDVKMSDLRVYCATCHELAHRLYKQGRYRFRNDNHHSRFSIQKAVVKKARGMFGRNCFANREMIEAQGSLLD